MVASTKSQGFSLRFLWPASDGSLENKVLIMVFYNKIRRYVVQYTKNRMQNDVMAIGRSIVKADQIPTTFGPFKSLPSHLLILGSLHS